MEAKFKVEIVPTSAIKPGDTVKWLDGRSRTVCRKDIDKDPAAGVTIFGNPLVLQDRKIKRFVVSDGKLVGDDNGETL